MTKAEKITPYFVKNQDGVHLVSPFFDFTLCMDTLDGDGPRPGIVEIEPMVDVDTTIVTCKKCIEIIRLCQGVKYERE